MTPPWRLPPYFVLPFLEIWGALLLLVGLKLLGSTPHLIPCSSPAIYFPRGPQPLPADLDPQIGIFNIDPWVGLRIQFPFRCLGLVILNTNSRVPTLCLFLGSLQRPGNILIPTSSICYFISFSESFDSKAMATANTDWTPSRIGSLVEIGPSHTVSASKSALKSCVP